MTTQLFRLCVHRLREETTQLDLMTSHAFLRQSRPVLWTNHSDRAVRDFSRFPLWKLIAAFRSLMDLSQLTFMKKRIFRKRLLLRGDEKARDIRKYQGIISFFLQTHKCGINRIGILETIKLPTFDIHQTGMI